MQEKFTSVLRHEVFKTDENGTRPFYSSELRHDGLDRNQLCDINEELVKVAGGFAMKGRELANKRMQERGERPRRE